MQGKKDKFREIQVLKQASLVFQGLKRENARVERYKTVKKKKKRRIRQKMTTQQLEHLFQSSVEDDYFLPD